MKGVCTAVQTIIYTVLRIDGDYAVLHCDGIEDTKAALMLLPDEVEEGMSLKYENMEYTILK